MLILSEEEMYMKLMPIRPTSYTYTVNVLCRQYQNQVQGFLSRLLDLQLHFLWRAMSVVQIQHEASYWHHLHWLISSVFFSLPVWLVQGLHVFVTLWETTCHVKSWCSIDWMFPCCRDWRHSSRWWFIQMGREWSILGIIQLSCQMREAILTLRGSTTLLPLTRRSAEKLEKPSTRLADLHSCK